MIQRMEHDKPEVKSGARSCEPSTSQVVRFTYHLAASKSDFSSNFDRSAVPTNYARQHPLAEQFLHQAVQLKFPCAAPDDFQSTAVALCD